MKVLVLGATGTVGRRVVQALLGRGDRVRVLTRNPDKAGLLGANVEVKAGDLTKPETLGPAFEGIDGLFLLNAVTMTETHEGLAALEWAKRAAVKKLVYLSVHHVDDAPHIPHFGAKVAIEAAIRKSGIDYTILRPNNFYQNDDGLKDVIVKHGVYPQPMSDIGLNRVDVRDIAEAAAQAFAGRAPNQTIALVGPDVLTGSSTAQVYSRHLGKTIAYGGNDLDAWEKQVLQFLPPWMVFDLKMMYAHFQKHGLRATADELKTLETLLGHAPRSFDTFVGEMVAPRS
jgi:uncharacterized protein YbjT (DUF2867 family)